MREAVRRIVPWAALGLLASVVAEPLARQGSPDPAPPPADPPSSRPQYLELPADQMPAQEAFRYWPPAELLETPHWQPWGAASFRRAGLFARPVVFVLTVDWSGIAREMVTEILTDPEVATRINRDYIGIYANADRRPDLKERYQTGNWPVVAILLPDGKPMLSQAHDLSKAQPIIAGRVTRGAMLFILEESRKYWEKWTGLLIDQAATWAAQEGEPDPVGGPVDEEASDGMARWLLSRADRVNGGFGAAPRFLIPALAEYAALRRGRGRDDLFSQTQTTLLRMVASPLFDAEAGGVRRIAMRLPWDAVQPEKMLVGNAHLLRELIQTLRQEESAELRLAAVRTAAFLRDVLARDDGGLCLAAFPTGNEAGIARDCQILAGPNSLAGAALLRAGAFLEDDTLTRAGRRAIGYVMAKGLRPGRGVAHILDPHPDQRIFLTAQSDVALGLLDAYESTGDRALFEAARQIVEFALINLRAPGEVTLRDHLADADAIGLLANPRRPLRPNVRLARALLRLTIHGLSDGYHRVAGEILGHHAGDYSLFGVHGTEAALAAEEWLGESLRVSIQGSGDEARALRVAALSSPYPWTVVLTGSADGTAAAKLSWNDSTEIVTDPARLHERIRVLTGRSGA